MYSCVDSDSVGGAWCDEVVKDTRTGNETPGEWESDMLYKYTNSVCSDLHVWIFSIDSRLKGVASGCDLDLGDWKWGSSCHSELPLD